MTMGQRIRTLRNQRKMSMEELGLKLGVGKSAILKYENGQVENIPRSTIIKMASLFDVTPSYLMCFDNENKDFIDKQIVEDYILSKYGDKMVQLFDVCLSLNNKSQEKLFEYAKDLETIEKFESMKKILK